MTYIVLSGTKPLTQSKAKSLNVTWLYVLASESPDCPFFAAGVSQLVDQERKKSQIVIAVSVLSSLQYSNTVGTQPVKAAPVSPKGGTSGNGNRLTQLPLHMV